MSAEVSDRWQEPKVHSDKSRDFHFTKITKIVSFVADLAVIIGIIVAFAELHQARETERCNAAMAAIAGLHSPQFLDAYRELVEAYPNDLPDMSESNRQRLYYVLNVYDDIAVLALRGVADEQLIKASTYHSMQELTRVLDAYKLPSEYRTNIDLFLKRFASK